MAEGLFGDAMATNNFMVGVAYQAGTIPLKAESIEQAIKNSGVGVEQSLAAFRWGRMADRAFVEAEIAKQTGADVSSAEGRTAAQPAARAIVDSVGAQGRGQAPAGNPRARPDRLPGRSLRQALRRGDQARRRRRTACPAGQPAVRGRRPLPLQADGLRDEFEVARLPPTRPSWPSSTRSSRTATRSYNLAPPPRA